MKSKFLATIALVFLIPLIGVIAGCTVKPNSPAQAVYQVEAEYNIALQAAVDYKNLPACSTGVSVVCSDPAIVKKLQDADKTAASALAQAGQVALSPNAAKTDIDKALAIAQTALAVLTQIEAQLKTK
jgi:hypothetical protein